MLPDSFRTAQSRMKCRKVLGLGESADGHIPKSKISQLLGHDHLNHIVIEQGNYPRGLRYFQWATCLMFGIVGLVNIFFPQHFYRTSTPNAMEPSSLVRHISGELKSWHTEWSKKNGANKNLISSLEENLASLEESMTLLEVPVRLLGVACLSLSALFLIVSVINSDNRRAIRIALIVEAFYFIIGIFVTMFTTNPISTENTTWLTDPTSLFWMTSYKAFGVLLCAYYYRKTNPIKHSAYTS